MSYEKPEIIAGSTEERESFGCGCPTYNGCYSTCQSKISLRDPPMQYIGEIY